MMLKSPIKWYGGKQKLASRLIALLPPHQTYVEVFGGAGHMLFAKPRSAAEVYNDLDDGLVNLFRVLRDPDQAVRLRRLLDLTPYARVEHTNCKDTVGSYDDPVEEARRLLVNVRQAYNGIVDGTWRFSFDASDIQPFYSAIGLIEPACRRLRGVYIEHDDFEEILSRWDRKDTCFVLDPPYLSDTRVAKSVYRHEMSTDDHTRLLTRLNNLDGMAMLCGYPHPLYDSHLSEWHHLTIPTRCWSTPGRSGARLSSQSKSMRTEAVWLNPQAVAALAGARRNFPGSEEIAVRTGVVMPKHVDRSDEVISITGRSSTASQVVQAEPISQAVTSRSRGLFTSEKDNWGTPSELFNALDSEFGFEIDVCADAGNAKCSRFYTVEDDGLRQDWGRRTCWMNPPYGRTISIWMEKAFKSSRFGATVACLIPARTDTEWWHRWVVPADEIRFLPGRVRFNDPKGQARASAPFPSAVIVYRRRQLPQDIFGDELEDARRFWGMRGRQLAPWLYV